MGIPSRLSRCNLNQTARISITWNQTADGTATGCGCCFVRTEIAMERTVILAGAIVVGLRAVPVTAQVNMQYGGEANGQYSGRYPGQSNGQVNEQVDGRADRDRSQSSNAGEATKQAAPVDQGTANDAQSMDAVERPGLQQR
jgi:hypothetical protein